MLLGAAYMSGTRLPKDRQLSARYLLQAAKQDPASSGSRGQIALAQYWLARMYEQGSGVERSHETAIQYLQLAASNGNYPAQYDLGTLYNDGAEGMTVDKARACELFAKAADQGHVKASHNAGFCYQNGIAGDQDANKAINYYTRAAEAGNTGSQHNLGILFGQMGQAEKSYFWLHVAESSGDTQVTSLIETVKTHLAAPLLEAQEKEVAAWLDAHKGQKQ